MTKKFRYAQCVIAILILFICLLETKLISVKDTGGADYNFGRVLPFYPCVCDIICHEAMKNSCTPSELDNQ